MPSEKLLARESIPYPENEAQRPYREITRSALSGDKYGLDVAVSGTVSVSSAEYAVVIDSSVSGTTYYGFAAPGSALSASVWKIKRGVEVSGVERFTFADGNESFDNIWDDRATLSYS